ncbi:hypothetical protein EW145_g7753 [Phellinidium pouzarii]|uniref:Uncharacterized protein n=1 Tax=Phellinidium pouzarii TaxID=167371 RepID=A0A4S4KGC4_9AGAM|nr:hypothetical protein EW145_g7753 [Phellinidium pouzarii]
MDDIPGLVEASNTERDEDVNMDGDHTDTDSSEDCDFLTDGLANKNTFTSFILKMDAGATLLEIEILNKKAMEAIIWRCKPATSRD